MTRLILQFVLGLLTVGLAFAGQPSSLTAVSTNAAVISAVTTAASVSNQSSVTKIQLLDVFKSVEGGIAVNPVTHKAYVIAESGAEGADDAKGVFVFDEDALSGKSAPKMIPIEYENEYIAIDSTRNLPGGLIYVPTKYSVEGAESDDDAEGDDGVDTGVDSPEAPVVGEPVKHLGTLTVIDGNTDTVIAVYTFAPGVNEPEGIDPKGVAVDPGTGVVYVAAKAPEGESSTDDVCNPWAIPIYDVGEPADVECWTAGHIYAFFVDLDPALDPSLRIKLLKDIPAGDDPESLVFANGMVYAANEDDGTVTIASAVDRNGVGGALLTDQPQPPDSKLYTVVQNKDGVSVLQGPAPYSLGVFYPYGPNPLACLENQYEADKMAAGGDGWVFLTDDRSRVAKIKNTAVVGMQNVPGATACEYTPNTDGGGLNTANNLAFLPSDQPSTDGTFGGILFVVSEKNTVALYNAANMKYIKTIVIPDAQHLDGIAVDEVARKVWLTDEDLQAVFVIQGGCVNNLGACK